MKRAVVVCPGRGTYGREELGYLARYFPDEKMLDAFDAQRAAAGFESLRGLDGAEKFSARVHMAGDAASSLIYAASLGDFWSIDTSKIEIVAVTGNSLGWYSALACGGVLDPLTGFKIVNTTGHLMQKAARGGQVVYPVVEDDWRFDAARRASLLEGVAEINARADHALGLSIDLGGMLVLAGDENGLAAFSEVMPQAQGRYPMRLANHAAFHTEMQAPVAEQVRAQISSDYFASPKLPMIDGRGAIWWPHATDTNELWRYTLDHQICRPYDFARAITVAAREFAPDLFIVTGPGTTMGGAVAQTLVAANWRRMTDKASFQALQKNSSILAAMGRSEQRAPIVR